MVKIYTAPRWSLSLLKEKIDVVIDAMDVMVLVDVAMGDEVRQGYYFFFLFKYTNFSYLNSRIML